MATLKLTSTDEQEKAEDKQEQMNPPNPIAEKAIDAKAIENKPI